MSRPLNLRGYANLIDRGPTARRSLLHWIPPLHMIPSYVTTAFVQFIRVCGFAQAHHHHITRTA